MWKTWENRLKIRDGKALKIKETRAHYHECCNAASYVRRTTTGQTRQQHFLCVARDTLLISSFHIWQHWFWLSFFSTTFLFFLSSSFWPSPFTLWTKDLFYNFVLIIYFRAALEQTYIISNYLDSQSWVSLFYLLSLQRTKLC